MRSRSPSPVLTPRAKIKAMLAGMESSSDDDDGDEDLDELMKKAAKPPKAMEERKRLDTSSEDEDENVSEDEEVEEVEDEPVRPRGKLAARMMASHTPKAVEKDDNAYKRVRKSIFGGGDPVTEEEHEKAIDPTPRNDQLDDNDDVDDDIPLPTSRRKKTPLKPSAQRNSPTLVSPSPSKPAPQSRSATPPDADEDSEPDALPANLLGNERFLALVARKRKEREDKEAAEALRLAARRAAFDAQHDGNDDEDDSGADNVASQRAPTRRKAGKKALEEMHKETQRMARSMQLAHQAKTRKKITKQSLFDKFNFMPSEAINSRCVPAVIYGFPRVLISWNIASILIRHRPRDSVLRLYSKLSTPETQS